MSAAGSHSEGGGGTMRFLVRRLMHTALLFTAISVFSFLLSQLAPGEYLDEMRLNPQISPQTVAALRAQYGLDRPLWARYASWVVSVVRGDWGFSFSYNVPVARLLGPRALNTLLLTLSASLLVWLLAIPLGICWAAKRQPFWDRLWGLGTATLLGLPEVLLALFLLLLAVKTNAFPVGGMRSVVKGDASNWSQLGDLARHLCLPVVALVLSGIGVLIRHVHASVAEVLDAPFVRAVRARGIAERRLLFRYVLPAAANPMITLVGFSVAFLLSGSLLVEIVMGWPGVGPLLLESILARDFYVVIGVVMCSAGFLVVGNLVADVLLYLTDPRIRLE